MPRYDYDALMAQLKSYEEIVEIEPLGSSYPGPCWGALLKNHKDVPSCFYDMSHGELSIRIGHVWNANPNQPGYEIDKFTANLYIHSIDDGSIVLLGPMESLEKARNRALLLKAEAESWGGWIPTEEQVEAAAKKTGCFWNR